MRRISHLANKEYNVVRKVSYLTHFDHPMVYVDVLWPATAERLVNNTPSAIGTCEADYAMADAQSPNINRILAVQCHLQIAPRNMATA
jgi:hypothetical protein